MTKNKDNPSDYRHLKRATEWSARLQRINKEFKVNGQLRSKSVKILLFVSECQDQCATLSAIAYANVDTLQLTAKNLVKPVKCGMLTCTPHPAKNMYLYTLTPLGIAYLDELERAQRQAKPSRRFATAARRDLQRRIKYIK